MSRSSAPFIHTEKNGAVLNGHLSLDSWSGMLVADFSLAMEDEKDCRRKSMSLIDWNVYNYLLKEREENGCKTFWTGNNKVC